MKHPELQYLNLISKIIQSGERVYGRNGYTRSILGTSMRFSLTNNQMPLLTTKRVAWKTCFNELMWFIRGQTDNNILRKQKVHIWDGNAKQDFLHGKTNRNEGDLGPIYGHQWRYFNAPYKTSSNDYSNKGVDQMQMIIDQLKKRSTSRRLILSAWNPEQIDEMALPPCHILAQFFVTGNDELSCSLYQRSGDVGLGIPFNIASYSFLTHILGFHCNLRPKEFIHFIGNAHIYEDHLEALETQITRTPTTFPKIKITNKKHDINDYTVNDINILNYKPLPKIAMKMRP